MEVDSILSKKCINSTGSNIVDLVWYCPNKRYLSIFPKQILDVSGWISVIPGQTVLPVQFKGSQLEISGDKIFVLLEADYNTYRYDYEDTVIELESYGIPKAWHTQENMSILLETDDVHFSSFCVAFQNSVALENGIQIQRCQTVSVEGSPYTIQNVLSVPQYYSVLNSGPDRAQIREDYMSRWRAHVSMLCTFCDAVHQVRDTQQEISVRHPGCGVGAVRLVPSRSDPPQSSETIPEGTTLNKTLSEDLGSTEAIGEPSSPSMVTSIASNDTTLPTRAEGSITASVPSLGSLPSTPKRAVRPSSAKSQGPSKPPNIVIFSDSSSAHDSVKHALDAVLPDNEFSIHTLPTNSSGSTAWFSHTALAIVHGNVSSELTKNLIEFYFTHGGSILSLCSDLLGSFLPVFRTAEVKPNELVQFSYKTWKHVPLLHHLFCYQRGPSTPEFSLGEQSLIPASVEIKDKGENVHQLQVEVLGAEETWRTPSLLLVSSKSAPGKIIFSQVHLEVDPSQYEVDESKRKSLEKSDQARLEMLCDLLKCYFGINCSLKRSGGVSFTQAYFLGCHEPKQKLLDNLREQRLLDTNNSFECGELTLKFCGKGSTPPPATSNQLPILMHACPQTFSTVEYFDNLNTSSIGRTVIYSQIMNSTMFIAQGQPLCHGLAVVADQQLKGLGRGGNTWLSPEGCAMFTVQLHIPMSTFIGQHISFLQHMASLAVVSAVCKSEGLEDLDIGIKWPNDVYAGKTSKIGGITTATTIVGDIAICNIGCGINLFNKKPTTCLNEMIKDLNHQTGRKVPILSKEKYFALVFNELEALLEKFNKGEAEDVYNAYYRYWLHGDGEVLIQQTSDGVSKQVTIKGIDPYGFLLVETDDGSTSVVRPDGNTFDMMSGLIAPHCRK